ARSTGVAPPAPPPPPPPPPGSRHMTAAERAQFDQQRAALERARQTLEAQRAFLEISRQAFEVDRQQLEKARQLLEKTLKEQADKLQFALSPEVQKKLEELHLQMDELARQESDKALHESAQARQESGLATKEADLARQEATLAARSADLALRQAIDARTSAAVDAQTKAAVEAQVLARLFSQEAEAGKLDAERMKAASREEMDKRRKYAKDKFGGEDTDRGRTVMRYGLPDEMEVYDGNKGEAWRYESKGADKAVTDFHFDANGKLVNRTGSALSPGERERRVKYANDKWASQGGAKSDKGKAYIKYGPPDEIKTGSSGETWLYKNEAKDQVRLEVTFDGNGKGQWVKKNSSAGPIGSSLSWHFQDAPDLR
ncbi:MAG: GWxTD domain-containing protein, partial [Bryobacteraceae bacterium]